MVREDLITSAVSFLQDPSVATAPVDKRIAFLQSKNLTQEEIDVALARAGEPSNPAPTQSSAPTNYAYRQAPPPPPGYPPYPSYWQQPPSEVPRRDWRDWFIMATVLGGVGYGLYFTAKRYVMPLIAPPTPPQLEQDKKSVDESFEKAFALIDQLTTDTAALKKSEEERTQRLDQALAEMETVISSLKESQKRRDDDGRRFEGDIRSLKDLIPKAMDAQKEGTATQLRELGTELKSLKTLVANRMSAGAQMTAGRPSAGTPNPYGTQGATNTNTNGTASGSATPSETSAPPAPAAGSDNITQSAPSNTATPAPDRVQSSSPYGRLMNGRAAIPAWQMAASKKAQPQEEETKKDTSESGTVSEASGST